MGSWFSNIHIRKKTSVTQEAVAAYISKLMAAKQYLPAASENDADGVVVIVTDSCSQWISVCSDLLSHDDPESCAAIAAPISAELHTDVLGISCFDSDYLYLNLINAEEQTDAWVGIGRASDVGIKRRSGLTAWKKKVLDYPAFSASAKEQHICAEEFLTVAEPCLGLPVKQSVASVEYLKDIDLEEKATYLYFSRQEDAPDKARTRLVLHSIVDLPCLVERRSDLFVYNAGAESRGLSVYFLGPYVENDEVTFSDVCLQIGMNSVSVTPTKTQLPDGKWAYVCHDPDFVIPPKVPKRLSEEKRRLMEQNRWIAVKFVPHGNPRKTLDITVALVPDENPEGKVQWNVWQPWGSKKAFIEHHNKLWKRVMVYESNPDSCLPLLKEKDFD